MNQKYILFYTIKVTKRTIMSYIINKNLGKEIEDKDGN